MVYPAQIDTCSQQTLRDAYDYAQERNLPMQIHAAQSVTEFHEMQRRHGKTPIQFVIECASIRQASKCVGASFNNVAVNLRGLLL